MDFYNCRAVACGHILCVNLSDDPKAVYDALKLGDDFGTVYITWYKI
jgi:hypothetical protein